MIDLSGKRAVVTGGSRGIGQATAIALARAGADVCSFHLPDPEYAPLTAQRVTELGRKILMVEGDVANSAEVDACAHRIVEAWGGIDIWVNNASRLLVRPFLETTQADWQDLLQSNLIGYINGCRAAIREMLPRGTGKIINISSVTFSQPIANLSAYITAKGGVLGLTRSLALEYASRGLRINAIAPGAIETPLNAAAYDPEVRANYCRRIPAGHIGQPEEIADIVVFLASDAARYICGHELIADGGLHLNGTVGSRTT